jgi:hypothetical protein
MQNQNGMPNPPMQGQNARGGPYPVGQYPNGGGGQNPWTTPPQSGGGSYNQYQGQSPNMPSPADYQAVQQYSDQAYGNSRRYLDPQQAQQDRRLEQEMINKGIDPNSDMARQMQTQQGMQQNDQNNASAYSSMQFGQNIQNQMAQQAATFGALDMNQQGQEFNQMMGLEGVDFRNRGYNDGLEQYNDQITMALLGMNPIPVGSNTNPYNPYNTQAGSGNTQYGVGGRWEY